MTEVRQRTIGETSIGETSPPVNADTPVSTELYTDGVP